MREFRIQELADWVDWWRDLAVREGPLWQDGYFNIQDKPGYGLELNPGVAKAHSALSETWWGRPAAEPFVLPASVRSGVRQARRAL